MLSIQLKNPVDTYLGYCEDGNIYLDLFLYNAEDIYASPSFPEFTKFTAVYDPTYSRNILLNRKQLKELGIDLKGFVLDSRYGKHKGSDILSGHVVLDCIVPVLKASQLNVYKYSQPFSSIEVFHEERDTVAHQENSIIIGTSFIERFLLATSNKMADTMGLCGETIFTRPLASGELELWDRSIEDLGLYQALKTCEKTLMIGGEVPIDFEDVILNSPETNQNGVRELSVKSEKFEDVNPHETSSDHNKENKTLSKAQHKRLKAKQSKERIVKAQYIVSLEIKKYAGSEENNDKVERLSNLLLQLISSNTTTIQKQELIVQNFKVGNNGEFQIKEDV